MISNCHGNCQKSPTVIVPPPEKPPKCHHDSLTVWGGLSPLVVPIYETVIINTYIYIYINILPFFSIRAGARQIGASEQLSKI